MTSEQREQQIAAVTSGRCITCGQPVRTLTSAEGTSHYERTAEVAARDFARALLAITRRGRLGDIGELAAVAHEALARHPGWLEGES